jgi:hypothetical protein
MEKRFFTVEEARRLLPKVKRVARSMVESAQDLEEFKETARLLAELNSQDAGSERGAAYLAVILSLQTCIADLQEIGCLVKSVQDGLIDFPHLREGREVYLCWRFGEKDIQYWHDADSGFAGRTPLLDRD